MAAPSNESRDALVNIADNWRVALAATPLIAPPTNAALLVSGEGDDSGALQAEAARLGRASERTLTPVVPGNDAAAFAAEVDAQRIEATGAASRNVLIVAADADFVGVRDSMTLRVGHSLEA